MEGKEEAEDHYQNLSRAINEVPKHNILLVIGDFNGHIGKDKGNFSYHEVTNKNGNLMHDLAMENKLVITNTKF